MLRLAARFLLLRVLPRKLIPVLTVIEVANFLRSRRRRNEADRRKSVARTGRAVRGDSAERD